MRGIWLSQSRRNGRRAEVALSACSPASETTPAAIEKGGVLPGKRWPGGSFRRVTTTHYNRNEVEVSTYYGSW